MKKIQKSKKKIVSNIFKGFNWFLLFLSLFIFAAVSWTLKNFAFDSFVQIMYTVTMSAGAASRDIIFSFIKNVVIVPIIVFILIIIGYILYKKARVQFDYQVKIEVFQKKYTFNLLRNVVVKIIHIIFWILPCAFFAYSVYNMGIKFYIWEYIAAENNKSTLFEEIYVNPENVKVSFEGKKRNLIYIFSESMESTFADVKSGGAYKKNYIPELTKLAKDNISFSNTELLGGARQINGTSWTMGAIMAHTSGIPYKLIYNFSHKDYQRYEQFVPGAYSIGEILEDNGYKNYMMVGSDGDFGGRKTYFKEHGNYTMYDYYTAIEDGIIDEDYYVFWGHEDAYLFEYAKEKLTEISQKDEPFNFSMLTVDTHAPHGFVSDFCDGNDPITYLNAISCSSSQISDFIKWIQKQDFYENTTIVLVGDHTSMNHTAFDNLPEGFSRRIYNAFINSVATSENTTNRTFTSLDFYPTTLAAMGATIEGDRLGLGTNLFSDKKTYPEEMTLNKFYNEMSKTSTYYINCIHSDKCN